MSKYLNGGAWVPPITSGGSKWKQKKNKKTKNICNNISVQISPAELEHCHLTLNFYLFDKLKSKSQQMMLLTASLMTDRFGLFLYFPSRWD